MKARINIIYSTLLALSLIACTEDTSKPDNSSSSNSSISSSSESSTPNATSSNPSSSSSIHNSSSSSSSSSASSVSNTVPLASFTSSIIGDHSVLTNAIIKDLIAEYPLFSAIPALVTLKKKEELKTFISDSQALGFDKEQFDTLYQATFIVMEAIRLSYLDGFPSPIFSFADTETVDNEESKNTDTPENNTAVSKDPKNSPSISTYTRRIRVKPRENNTYAYENVSNYASDMQDKDLPVSPVDTSSPDIIITNTRTRGKFGKNDKYTFKIDQHFLLPGCQIAPEDCNLRIDVFTTFNFPTRNAAPELGENYSALYFTDVQISAARFKISNQNSSLNFSLNPKTIFTLNASHFRKGSWPETLIFMEILSEAAINGDTNTRSNIKGRFLNTYTDDNGNTKEIQVTGSMIGDIENMLFTANYNSDTPVEPSLGALIQADNFNNIEAVLKGQMSGLIEGANLEVNFVTEAIE